MLKDPAPLLKLLMGSALSSPPLPEPSDDYSTRFQEASFTPLLNPFSSQYGMVVSSLSVELVAWVFEGGKD